MAHGTLREPDIGSALQSMLRFLGLVFYGLQPRLERQGSLAQIVLDEQGEEPARAFACFTLWLMLHGLVCWLAGRRIAILGVELRCPAPDYCGDYRVMFSCHRSDRFWYCCQGG